MNSYKAIVAIKGLVGWYEEGRCDDGTFHRSPVSEKELTADILVDRSKLLENSDNPIKDIWKSPILDLSLPDDNFREMLEGCIGCGGSTKGRRWNGESLKGTTSVGLNVWLAYQAKIGAVITRKAV